MLEAPAPAKASPPSTELVSMSRIMALCAVGFFVNCQPSEAYLTHYLIHVKNLSPEQLDNDVWPYDTYGSFAFLLPIGVLAEVCGYRVAIGAGLLCREATRLLLLFTNGVTPMALMQLTYAGATAANTVYFAYVYMSVSPKQYLSVTCWIHMSYYLGNALGSLLGQMLYSYSGFDSHLDGLFYLSWGFTSVGFTIFVLFFPPAVRPAPPSLVSVVLDSGLPSLLQELRAMYSPKTIQLWSAWWLMGLGSHQMIGNYYQTQFSQIDPDCADTLGYVEAIMMLLSAIAATLPSFFEPLLNQHSTLLIVASSLVIGFLYYASTVWQSSVYYSYGFNITAISLYSFQYAAGSAVIATWVPSGRYAILFTANSFVSYGISTITQQVGSHKHLSTSAYYYFATGQQLVVVAGVAVVLVGWWLVGDDEDEECKDLDYRAYTEMCDSSEDEERSVEFV